MKVTRKVSEYMHSPVHTIGADQTLGHAKHEIYSRNIHHLPILEGGRCVGIMSDRDIKLAFAVEKNHPENILAKDACVTEVYEVSPQTELAVVARHMFEQRIGSAVIVENGKICGIFTVTDACKALADICSQ